MTRLVEDIAQLDPKLRLHLLQGRELLLYAHQLLVNQDGYSTSYLSPKEDPTYSEEREVCHRLDSIIGEFVRRIPKRTKKAACRVARHLPPGEVSIPVFCAFVFLVLDESGKFQTSVNVVGDPIGTLVAGFTPADLDRICDRFVEEVCPS